MSSAARGLLIGKLLYFFLYAGLGIFIPFLNVYYRETLLLSGTQIGLINTLGPLIAIFSGPLWGLLCDRLGRMKLVLGIVAVGAICGAVGLASARTFNAALGFTAFFNLFTGAIMPLVDSYNLALLGDQRERYSSQRIWGTLGFLVTSIPAGAIIGYAGLQSIFAAYAIFLGMFLLAVVGLPSVPAQMGRAVFKGFAQMLRQRVWIILGVAVILVMLANNSWVNFLSVALKQMGGNDGLVGWVWSVGAISEIPVMMFGSRLLYRLGAKKMMALGFFFYGLRMLFYGLMPAPEWALAIGMMHGVSFGFYWLGGVNYVSQITPDHLRATGQSMLATFFSIASVMGAPLVGVVFDQAGPARLFLLAAITAWVGLAIFLVGSFVNDAPRRTYTPGRAR
jgi:PPP family 3-phenylpropionic acid transporter